MQPGGVIQAVALFLGYLQLFCLTGLLVLLGSYWLVDRIRRRLAIRRLLRDSPARFWMPR